VIKLLLRRGFDVDERDEAGLMPLSLAIICGFGSIVRELISSGADTRFVAPCGTNLLCIAVSKGHNDIVDILLEDGRISIDAPATLIGYTPLMVAACHGLVGAVRHLLARGADPTLRSPSGFDAAAIALLAKKKKGGASPGDDTTTPFDDMHAMLLEAQKQ